jgi:hypothetical protein
MSRGRRRPLGSMGGDELGQEVCLLLGHRDDDGGLTISTPAHTTSTTRRPDHHVGFVGMDESLTAPQSDTRLSGRQGTLPSWDVCASPFRRCLHKRLPTTLAHHFNIDCFASVGYEVAQCLSCCQTSRFEPEAFIQFHFAGFRFFSARAEHFRDFLFTFFLSKEDGEGAF